MEVGGWLDLQPPAGDISQGSLLSDSARPSRFTRRGRYSRPGDRPSVTVTSITLDREEGEKVREEGLMEETQERERERVEAEAD